jgi:predicted lipid carrier protein YhbT
MNKELTILNKTIESLEKSRPCDDFYKTAQIQLNLLYILRDKMTRQEVEFLDFTIINTGNSDGWVITNNNVYENLSSHLGNYIELINAKKACLFYFMLAHPIIFADGLLLRTLYNTKGTVHEFYKLRNLVDECGLEMPKEITMSDDNNCGIMFNGEKF